MFWFKSTHDSKKYLEYWFELSYDSMIRINCCSRWPFWLSLNFVDLFWVFTWFRWPFWGFSKFRWPFLGIDSIKCLDSNQLMIRAVSRRIEPIQHMTQAVFPGMDSESIHDWNGFPRYWFRLTHDSMSFPIFWFKATHDSSESTWFSINSWFDCESITHVWRGGDVGKNPSEDAPSSSATERSKKKTLVQTRP